MEQATEKYNASSTSLTAPPLETVPVPAVASDFPDGGLRAWLVVLGGAFSTFSTFGYITAWGVFQAYYQDTFLQNESPSNIAWIGSIQYSLIFFPGLFIGRVFDLGYFHVPLFFSSALLVVTTFLTAECKTYWQFLLCQGIGTGLASGLIFGPSVSIISHWFRNRKGLALGLQAMGSAVGGVVFPIMIRNLIPSVGFKWALRITGFVLLFSLGVVNLTMRRRLPPKKGGDSFLSLGIFYDCPQYAAYTLSTVFAFLGLWTLLVYIDVSGVLGGLSPTFSFYLVAIANGAGGFGRIIGGKLSDSFGAINTMLPFTLAAAAITYIWPFALTRPGLVVIAVIYGFGSGVYIALLPAPVIHMGPIVEAGRRVGLSMSILALGALGGPPISGALLAHAHNFRGVGYFAGTCIVCACALMLLTKRLALGSAAWLSGKY